MANSGMESQYSGIELAVNPFGEDGGGQPPSEPYFDESTLKNVTALVGKSAYLNCRVRNIGNKTVSKFQFFLS